MTHEELLDKLKSLQLNYYTLDRYRGDEFDKEGCNLNCFDHIEFKKVTLEDFVEIPYTVHGDYVNCSVSNMSNSRLIKSRFKNIIPVWGSYSYSVLFVQLKDLVEDEELLDTIIGVWEYPILDDEDEWKLMEELAEEAWDVWIEYDFKRTLEKYIDSEDFDPDQYKLKDIFYSCMSTTGESFQSENNDVYIDLNRIVKQMIEKHHVEFWEILQENKKDKI